MIDRRKNLYCGPSHKLIPCLTALANYLRGINVTAMEIDMLNYASKKRLISSLAIGAIAEVDKLIMIDNKEVDNGMAH